MFDNFVSVLGDRFRQQYPQGSIISDLVQIHGDQYVVKVSVSLANTILVSTLAADANLTLAENHAIERALTILGIQDWQQPAHEPVNLTVTPLPDLPIGLTNSIAEGTSEAIIEDPRPEVLANSEPVSNLPTPIVIEEISLPPVPTVTAAEPIRIQAGVTSGISEQLIDFDATPSFAEPEVAVTMSIANGKVAVDSIPPEILSVTDMIPMINMELKRLGWSKDRGREYMVSLYNKRASALLSDDELFGLLQHLKAEPVI